MGISYSIFESLVTFNLGNRSGIAPYVPSWIGQAYLQVLTNPNFSFFELDMTNESLSTTTDVSTVSLAALEDIWFILGVRDETNARNLKKGDWKRFEESARTSGQPIWYDRYGTNLELDPVPDDVYDLKLRYRKRVPPLAAGGEAAVREEFGQLIVTLATSIGWRALQQYDKAGRELGIAQAITQSLTTADVEEDYDSENFSIEVLVED